MRIVPCPRCGRQVPYDASSRWRPFCSERCRMIDMGNWADEGYRVPESSAKPGDAEPDGDA